MFSSLAHNTTNDVILEFSTSKPSTSNDNAYAFCLSDSSYQQMNSAVKVLGLYEGGDQFVLNEKLIATSSNSSFFKSGSVAWDVDFLHVATIYDVLGTDPYFADSYRVIRQAFMPLDRYYNLEKM